MKRLHLLLLSEVKLARTALPMYAVIMVQPALFFLLMALVMVRPTFDVNVERPTTPAGTELVAAMEEVRSPVGSPYINPVLVEATAVDGLPQVIAVEMRDGFPTAVQRFGLVDGNLVKNLRNRLTAAALRLWQAELGERAVQVVEYPWLPRDVPYIIYFGMAMLPMVAFMAATFIGGTTAAQEFECRFALEYRLAPVRAELVVTARLVRLVVTALLSAAVALVTQGLSTGVWPDRPLLAALILVPMALIGGGLGTCAGWVLRRSIPTLVVGLFTSLGGWILGSAFGLAAGFGGAYKWISRLTPNTHAVELLFPRYLGITVGSPAISSAVLAGMGLGICLLTGLVYQRRVVGGENV